MGVTGELLLGLMLAQATPAGEAADAAQLERIRKALAEPPSITALPAPRDGATLFRITVFGRKPEQPLWVNWSAIPTYIRPFAPPYHYEFLKQVTPEEFRSGTLYPSGVPVVKVAEFLTRQIKAANRKRQESNARDEVRKALEELLACRANPDRPGC